jgi:N-acetylglutamate synthase-like GNAT family acetyltransferase
MSEGTFVVVRRAEVEDTDAVVTVLRRSITELCVADHRNDPGVLGAWLENKTAENVRTWIESPRSFMVVAEVGGAVCGVASLGITGGILLCYLLPEVQSTGVGRALLAGLEAEARRLGIRELFLESTVSARGFYSKQGFRSKEGGPADSSLLSKVLMT